MTQDNSKIESQHLNIYSVQWVKTNRESQHKIKNSTWYKEKWKTLLTHTCTYTSPHHLSSFMQALTHLLTIFAGGLRLKTRLLHRMWWWEQHHSRALSHSAVRRGVSASSRWSIISSFWARTAMFSSSFSICTTKQKQKADSQTTG